MLFAFNQFRLIPDNVFFFIIPDNDSMLLASGSKDASVRLWKFSFTKNLDELQESETVESDELKLKSVNFRAPSDSVNVNVSVLLDAVLAGHEGLVSEVCWARPVRRGKIIVYSEDGEHRR